MIVKTVIPEENLRKIDDLQALNRQLEGQIAVLKEQNSAEVSQRCVPSYLTLALIFQLQEMSDTNFLAKFEGKTSPNRSSAIFYRF